MVRVRLWLVLGLWLGLWLVLVLVLVVAGLRSACYKLENSTNAGMVFFIARSGKLRCGTCFVGGPSDI